MLWHLNNFLVHVLQILWHLPLLLLKFTPRFWHLRNWTAQLCSRHLLRTLALRSATAHCRGITPRATSFEHVTLFIFSVDTTQLVVAVLVVFVGNVYLFVWTLLVDLHNVLLSLLHEDTADVPHVSQLGSLFDLVCDMWIIREDLLLKELLWKRVGINFVDGHVDEFRLLVKANVVVANERMLFKLNAEMVRLVLGQPLSHQVVTNTNFTLQKEIHIRHFIFLV